MFSSLPAIEADIDSLIAQARYNDALANMVVGVHNHYKAPEVAHHALYYPAFDRQIERLIEHQLAAREAADALRDVALLDHLEA